MRSEGFTEISTIECLLREFQPRKITMPLYDHNKESIEYEDQDNPEFKKRKFDEEFSQKKSGNYVHYRNAFNKYAWPYWLLDICYIEMKLSLIIAYLSEIRGLFLI